MPSIAREIGRLLLFRDLTLGTVESATGGLIASLIVSVPGCSDYFQGSLITYSNALKEELAGVKEETLNRDGAVSAAVALAMASGGRRVLGVDICLSDTGIAGPGGGTIDKPAGLFFIGLSHHNGTFYREFRFDGPRQANRRAAALAALSLLRDYLLSPGLRD